MPFAPVEGSETEIYYEMHGSGPALLLAHGQGGNHLSWWQQVPVLSQHFTCISFDQRAFGFSLDRDGRGRSAFGSDAMALLDHLGVENVRVVAHSMGGRCATALAVRDPKQRCRALVLAGTTGAVADDAVRRRREEAALVRGERGLGAFSVKPGFELEQPEMYFLLRQISRLNPARPDDFLGPLNPPPPPPGQPPRIPMAKRLADAGVPVQFVVGEHDMITPPDLIQMCHSLLPGSRYALIEDSGHSAYWEKPEVFNEIVLSFLLEVAP